MYFSNFEDLNDLGRQLIKAGMGNAKVTARMISRKVTFDNWDGSADGYLDMMTGKRHRVMVYSLKIKGHETGWMTKQELIMMLNRLIGRV